MTLRKYHDVIKWVDCDWTKFRVGLVTIGGMYFGEITLPNIDLSPANVHTIFGGKDKLFPNISEAKNFILNEAEKYLEDLIERCKK